MPELPDNQTTLLVISGEGFPPYSTRGLIQTLDLIEQAGDFERDVNGELVDLSPDQMRKFKSTITCTDQQAPALEEVWPGTILTIQCANERSYKTAGGSPIRPVVAGSSRVDGDYTFYRPELIMMVISYTLGHNEYEAEYNWQLVLEEV